MPVLGQRRSPLGLELLGASLALWAIVGCWVTSRLFVATILGYQ